MTTKLFVGNLPETCRKVDFQKIFEEYGKVVECDIVRNYGFVHFEKEDEAKAAVEGLNNSDFEGSELKVELSHSKVRQKPGMGGKGECYRCGRNGHWSRDCPRGPSRARRKSERFFNSGNGEEPYGDYCRQGPFMNTSFNNDRYPPPPPMPNPAERFRPYPEQCERRPMQHFSMPPMNRNPFNQNPYDRPPPDYYRRPYQDQYCDSYYNRSGWD